MIERDGEVSVKRQAELLELSRSSVYYVARGLPERDLTLMRILDELHLKWPFYGARKLTRELQNQGHEVGRRHVTTLMRRMGMETIYRKPRTSIPAPLSKVYPYLLNGLKIERPNHVWAADLTYLPMAHGFQYLVAIIDVGSRKTLAWRVSKPGCPSGFVGREPLCLPRAVSPCLPRAVSLCLPRAAALCLPRAVALCI